MPEDVAELLQWLEAWDGHVAHAEATRLLGKYGVEPSPEEPPYSKYDHYL